MPVAYDEYYKTKHLFGEPYPELIDFFLGLPKKGRVLDLGCGQGRDTIPLAHLGFKVTGIDNSKVGIAEMNRIAKAEKLKITSIFMDIYEFDNFADYDFILLNSMFHFLKKDRKKEIDFIKKIVSKIKKECLVLFCIQDTENKVRILKKIISLENQLELQKDQKFKYAYEDNEHKSESDYRLIVIKKTTI